MKNVSNVRGGRGLAEPSQADIEEVAIQKAHEHSRETPNEEDIKAAQAEILGAKASDKPVKSP